MKRSLKVSLIVGIVGLSTIAYSLLQKKNDVTTFKNERTEITIIDLNQKNEINYLLIIGLLIVILSLLLFLSQNFFKSKNSDEENTLTPRENDILLFIEKGYSNKDISNELFISESTVKTHVNNIFKKKQVTKRSELIDN